MRAALAQARATAQDGNPGFGAVVVDAGRVAAATGNREVTELDPTAHDGVLAVRVACGELGRADLDGCTFYRTAELCLMCSAALLLARVSRVVIGASGPRSRRCPARARCGSRISRPTPGTCP